MLVERLAAAAVWAATALGTVLAVVRVTGGDVFTALALTLAASVALGIVAQLAVGKQAGFVLRLATCTVGSAVIVAAGAAAALAGA